MLAGAATETQVIHRRRLWLYTWVGLIVLFLIAPSLLVMIPSALPRNSHEIALEFDPLENSALAHVEQQNRRSCNSYLLTHDLPQERFRASFKASDGKLEYLPDKFNSLEAAQIDLDRSLTLKAVTPPDIASSSSPSMSLHLYAEHMPRRTEVGRSPSRHGVNPFS